MKIAPQFFALFLLATFGSAQAQEVSKTRVEIENSVAVELFKLMLVPGMSTQNGATTEIKTQELNCLVIEETGKDPYVECDAMVQNQIIKLDAAMYKLLEKIPQVTHQQNNEGQSVSLWSLVNLECTASVECGRDPSQVRCTVPAATNN